MMAKTDRRSMDLVFDSKGTNHQLVLLPPIKLQPPSLPRTLASSVFTPTGSPYPPASPNKLAVGGVGHSPGKQSTSLERATAGGVGAQRLAISTSTMTVTLDKLDNRHPPTALTPASSNAATACHITRNSSTTSTRNCYIPTTCHTNFQPLCYINSATLTLCHVNL